MSMLYPNISLKRITAISGEMLRSLGIKALLLDVDNTLTTHNHPDPHADVLLWMDDMRREEIALMLVSNNYEKRVEPFARGLKLEYTANAAKPLSRGFSQAAKKLGCKPEETAVVGDQIFTDILGGNLFGATTILVEPMQMEDGVLFRMKRKMERGVLRRYRKKTENRKEG